MPVCGHCGKEVNRMDVHLKTVKCIKIREAKEAERVQKIRKRWKDLANQQLIKIRDHDQWALENDIPVRLMYTDELKKIYESNEPWKMKVKSHQHP